jgi:hypothetical protein
MRDLDSLENYNYLWDDVWIMERDNERTSEWPKGTSESGLPSTKD